MEQARRGRIYTWFQSVCIRSYIQGELDIIAERSCDLDPVC